MVPARLDSLELEKNFFAWAKLEKIQSKKEISIQKLSSPY